MILVSAHSGHVATGVVTNVTIYSLIFIPWDDGACVLPCARRWGAGSNSESPDVAAPSVGARSEDRG